MSTEHLKSSYNSWKESIKDRFMQHVEKDEVSGCWLWTASEHSAGYGQFNLQSKKGPIPAHRASFFLFKGPIENVYILHICDVKLCVNPDHLYSGTQQQNIQDAVERGLMDIKGEAHHAAVLTEPDIIKIRASDKSNKELGEIYGVTYQHIWQIRNMKRWTHV
jgi:hypothetical protein